MEKWKEKEDAREPLSFASVLNRRYILGGTLNRSREGMLYFGWDMKEHRRVEVFEFIPEQYWGSRGTGKELFPEKKAEFKDKKVIAQQRCEYYLQMEQKREFRNFGNCFEENGTIYAAREYQKGQLFLEYAVQNKDENESWKQESRVQLEAHFQELYRQGMVYEQLSESMFRVGRKKTVYVDAFPLLSAGGEELDSEIARNELLFEKIRRFCGAMIPAADVKQPEKERQLQKKQSKKKQKSFLKCYIRFWGWNTKQRLIALMAAITVLAGAAGLILYQGAADKTAFGSGVVLSVDSGYSTKQATQSGAGQKEQPRAFHSDGMEQKKEGFNFRTDHKESQTNKKKTGKISLADAGNKNNKEKGQQKQEVPNTKKSAGKTKKNVTDADDSNHGINKKSQQKDPKTKTPISNKTQGQENAGTESQRVQSGGRTEPSEEKAAGNATTAEPVNPAEDESGTVQNSDTNPSSASPPTEAAENTAGTDREATSKIPKETTRVIEKNSSGSEAEKTEAIR